MANKSKRIFFHIGLHKTATTFLQKRVFPKLNSVYYLDDSFKGLSDPLSKDKDSLLVSWEGLSGRPWDGLKQRCSYSYETNGYYHTFKCAIENIKSLCPDAEIILFVRRHDDFIASLYKQFIKKGGILTFDEFFGEKKLIQPEEILLERKIRVLKKSFEKVHLLDYSDLKNCPEHLFRILFQIIGEKHLPKIDVSQKVNPSLSFDNFEFMRKYNKYFFKIPRIGQRILSRINFSPERLTYSYRFLKVQNTITEDINTQISKYQMEFDLDWEYVMKIKTEVRC